MHPKLTLLFILILSLASCTDKKPRNIITEHELKQYYDYYKVDGSFVLYNANTDNYLFYKKEQYTNQYTPASTFKICNSLIGLETGVIPDEHYIIPWDSVVHPNPNWNQDTDLKMAFQNSTVWYYQELARRVGPEIMQAWLIKANYGNADISGGIDQFWLSGGLRISPKQQIDFLKRLHDNQLPFSQRSMDIVKGIMVREDTLDYVLRGKTGWGYQDSTDIGWFVGYLEKGEDVYYFANCIQSTDTNNYDNFNAARVNITMGILKNLQLINPKGSRSDIP